MVDPRDVAAVAAITLTEDGHEGETYALTGPEAITYGQIAGCLSVATGRTIEFVDIPDDAARQGMLEQGMPEFVVDFLVKLFGVLRDGIAAETIGTVRALTGRESRGLPGSPATMPVSSEADYPAKGDIAVTSVR